MKIYKDNFRAEFTGRFVADPEYKQLATTNLVNFTIASSKADGTPEYRKCTAFKGIAEHIAEGFKKGEKVHVFCNDQRIREYENKDKVKGISVEWFVYAISKVHFEKAAASPVAGEAYETPIQ